MGKLEQMGDCVGKSKFGPENTRIPRAQRCQMWGAGH